VTRVVGEVVGGKDVLYWAKVTRPGKSPRDMLVYRTGLKMMGKKGGVPPSSQVPCPERDWGEKLKTALLP